MIMDDDGFEPRIFSARIHEIFARSVYPVPPSGFILQSKPPLALWFLTKITNHEGH